MSSEPVIASDVLIDLSDMSLAGLPEDGDSCLLRALSRILAADDESDVIAEWNNGT